MSEQKEIITYMTIYWDNDNLTEYDDIVSLEVGTEFGYPRMCIRDSDNIVEVINLNFVQSYQAKLETAQ